MDELLIRQLSRQLKILNFWITFFGVLFLICFIIAGFLIYKAVTDLHKAENNFNSFQQKTEQDLNVQQKLCDNSTVRRLVGSSTCN